MGTVLQANSETCSVSRTQRVAVICCLSGMLCVCACRTFMIHVIHVVNMSDMTDMTWTS